MLRLHPLNDPRRAVTMFIVLVSFVARAHSQEVSKPSGDANPLPADLAIVPADTHLFVSVNLGAPWNGVEAESLKHVSSLHPVIPSWALKELPAKVGVEPDNIERMIQLSDGTGQVALLTTVQPYDRGKVLGAFVPAATEKSAGGKQYSYSEKSNNSVYFVDDRTLLLGAGQDLQAFLARRSPPERDASLDSALRAVHSGAPFVVHAGPRVVQSFANDQNLAAGPYAALAKARTWQIVAEINRGGLTIGLLADFANAQDATNATAAFKLVGEKLAAFMHFMKEHMVPFLNQQESQYPGASELAPKMAAAIDAAAEALKTANVRSKNTRAGAQIAIKTDEPLTTALLLLTLTPRAQK